MSGWNRRRPRLRASGCVRHGLITVVFTGCACVAVVTGAPLDGPRLDSGHSKDVDHAATGLTAGSLHSAVRQAAGGGPPVDRGRVRGWIGGRVQHADGRPAAGAIVRLEALGGATRTTRTDGSGRFEITGILPGVYRLTATAGALRVEYGQTGPGRLGRALAIRNGDALVPIELTLPRGSVIGGTIVGADGHPVEGLIVQAWRIEPGENGIRMALAPGVQASRTDDVGRYRIHGVPPGTYHVVASEVIADGPTPATGIIDDLAVAHGSSRRVFYPGRSSVAEALAVRIDVDADVLAFDIVFAPDAAARVRGQVFDASGQAVREGVVTLQTSSRSRAPMTPARRERILEDGTFEFGHVPRGEYVVQAMAGSRSDCDAACLHTIEMDGLVRDFGMRPVVVTGEDVFTVLHVAPPSTFTGRVILDGAPRESMSSFDLRVVWTDSDHAPGRREERVHIRTDGVFSVPVVSGPVRVVLSNAPPDWFLRSTVIGGIDATDWPFWLHTDGRTVIDGEVVLSSAGARIAGDVMDGRRAALDYAVVVFSTNPIRWFDRSPYLEVVRSGADGTFMVSGLPPGDYWIAAIDREPVSGDWLEPGLLTHLISGARRIILGEGERIQTRLRLARLP